MTDELDDARAALAELHDLWGEDGGRTRTSRLLARCRPLLDPSESEATFAKIREIHHDWHGPDLDGAEAMFLIGEVLYPPPRSIEVGDTVNVGGFLRRKVLGVCDDGTVNIAFSGFANFINVNADDCTKVDQ